MTSIAKNFQINYEELIGDAINLRENILILLWGVVFVPTEWDPI